MSSDSGQDTIPISVCILTKNNENKIERCLSRLTRFDEILVLDTGSSDRTLEIVARFPRVRVFHQEGVGSFGKTRNMLTEKAKNDWVVHVDSDEFLTPELVDRIGSLELNPKVIYAFRHRLFYRDKPLTPFDSWLRRLYNRKSTSWSLRAVHESLISKEGMTTVRIPCFVDHHSYQNVDHMIAKAQLYSSLYADQFYEEKRGSTTSAVFHGAFTFFKHYILRGCLWYGFDGFIVAFCQSLGSFLKYIKLEERRREKLFLEAEKKKTGEKTTTSG